MKLNPKIFKNLKKKKDKFNNHRWYYMFWKKFICRITEKETYKIFPRNFILSKDLFLYPRTKRIKITKNINKINNKNQNSLHYDLAKLRILLNFLIGRS